MESQTTAMKVVYSVIERAPGKSYWNRIGIGFVNKDGSLNLRLDAIPLTGTIQVRDWEPPPERAEHDRTGRGKPNRDRDTGMLA